MIFRSYAWSGVDRLVTVAGFFLIHLFLARISEPDQFANIAFLIAIIVVIQSLSEAGMSTSLLRLKNISATDYKVALSINVAVGLILSFCLFFFAEKIDALFPKFELKEAIVAISPLGLIYAYSVTSKVSILKAYGTRLLAIVSVCSMLLAGVSVLIWHYVFKSTAINLAIIFYLVFSLCYVVLLVLNSKIPKRLPKIRLKDWSRNDDFFMFSFASTCLSLLNSVFNSAYLFFLGNVFSATEISALNQATRYSNLIPSNLSIILARVNFTRIVELKDQKETFYRFLENNFFVISVITGGSAITLSLLSEHIVLLLLGEKWFQVVPLLELLFLRTALLPINALCMNLINALGGSLVVFLIEALKKSIFVIMLFYIYDYPAIYFCYGLMITSAVSLVIHLVVLKYIIRLDFLKCTIRPMMIFVFYGASFIVIKEWFDVGSIFLLTIAALITFILVTPSGLKYDLRNRFNELRIFLSK